MTRLTFHIIYVIMHSLIIYVIMRSLIIYVIMLYYIRNYAKDYK